jgi:ferredoxin--NADP+ reductase
MMKAVADVTRKEHIHTVVSLNPIMIDGTGMCGGCRVLIDSKSEFACVDGPEFDAHRVNFEVLVQRNAMYREAERRSMAEFQQEIEAKRQTVRQELEQLRGMNGSRRDAGATVEGGPDVDATVGGLR